MNIKLIGALLVAVVIAGLGARILMLKADVSALKAERSDLRAEVARQEELVRNREARIAGLEQVVAVRDQEIAAVNGQVAATQKAMEQFNGRIRQMQKILSAAVAVDAKPGSVIDDETNRAVVRHLNQLVVPPVLRDEAAAAGNPHPGTGEMEPVPQAVWGGHGAYAVGRDTTPGQP